MKTINVVDIKYTGNNYEVELTDNNGTDYTFEFEPEIVMNAVTRKYMEITINEIDYRYNGFKWFSKIGKEFKNGKVTFPDYEDKFLKKIQKITDKYMQGYTF